MTKPLLPARKADTCTPKSLRKPVIIALIALLFAIIAYASAEQGLGVFLILNCSGNITCTQDAANQTLNLSVNASITSPGLAALQANDTYFNGTVFPVSTDFRNNTMYNYFESGKANKSGDTFTGTVYIADNTPVQIFKNTLYTYLQNSLLEYFDFQDKNGAEVGFFGIGSTGNNDMYVGSTHNNATLAANTYGGTGGIFMATLTGFTAQNMASGAQSNALCYNTGTKVITYNSGITTCTASNESLKSNITNITGDITPFLMNLTPIKYKLVFENTNELHVGFSAQSVKSVIANTPYNNTLIGYNPDGTVSGLRYEEMIPFLVKVIQEQQNTINQQQSTLNKICTNYPAACK